MRPALMQHIRLGGLFSRCQDHVIARRVVFLHVLGADWPLVVSMVRAHISYLPRVSNWGYFFSGRILNVAEKDAESQSAQRIL